MDIRFDGKRVLVTGSGRGLYLIGQSSNLLYVMLMMDKLC